MIGKSCSVPFAYSQIALLIFSLTLVPRSVHAEPNEAPAVLQFARKYQAQQSDTPQRKPVTTPKKVNKTVHAPSSGRVIEQKPANTGISTHRLSQLQRDIAQKEQEINTRNLTIKNLEKKVIQLQQGEKSAPAGHTVASQKDAQMVQKMASSLRQSFSLQPDSAALTEKLKQANKQVSDARQAEAEMRDRQTKLIAQIEDLNNQLTAVRNSAAHSASESEATINAQLKKLHTTNLQLESELEDSRKNLSHSSEQIRQLSSALSKLENEKKKYIEYNQNLKSKLDSNTLTAEQLTSVKQQQNKLQDELNASKQLLEKLQTEKQQLKQQLTDAPTSAQLADSQEKINVLRAQLDSAAAQQIAERKTSESALAAEKKIADTKIQALQEQLNTAQAQQRTLLTEKQQIEQKLQSDLLGNDKNRAIISSQLQTLRDELTALQQQQQSLLTEKEKLQQQLDNAPTSEQLAESVLKVKALQSQLDAALLQQKNDSSELAKAKTSGAALIAEKKSAEDKVRELQKQLETAQAQQKTVLAEQAQLQQKLQTALLGKEKNGAAITAQLTALQDKLTTAQQQQATLQSEKEKLQQQLDNAPTSEQLAESVLKVNALQSQLDAALLQQKNDSSELAKAKTSGAALIAEKKSAEDKVRELQKQLETAQAQQKTVLAEQAQLQQKLQTALLGKEKNGTAITAQLTELQGKLTATLQQQATLQSEKEKLQQQLDNAPTSEQLSESLLKIKALQNQVDTLTLLSQKVSTDSSADKVGNVVQEIEKKVAEDKIKALQDKLDAAQAQLATLEKQSVSPDIKGVAQLTSEKLKKKSTREAYAIGVSLGEEILQLQAENRNWASTDSDRPSVLAGIIDSFHGKTKLPPEDLQKTLMSVSEQVKVGRDKFMNELDKSTKKFIANFTKNKNTKKSDLGFWYRVGYPGDVAIPEGATIDVIVKESLTNGVVIEDMDAKGIVLTQPISAFPPVFREALSKLRNHGSITIVVPPELAYGDKGYPPKVPPNATMVYELRVSDIYPEAQKKTTAGQ